MCNRALAMLALVFILTIGCAYLIAASSENAQIPSNDGIGRIEIDLSPDVTYLREGLGWVILIFAFSGPPLAIYCAFKKLASLFIKRLSITALIVLIPVAILLIGFVISENVNRSSHIELAEVIFMIVPLLSISSWIFVLCCARRLKSEACGG